MGNNTEYYNLLLSDFEKEFGAKLKPITDNASYMAGEWELKGQNFNEQDTLMFDSEQNINNSNSYQFYKIPTEGVLSLYSHYDAAPDYDLEEGYEEVAFYAHWINENTLHLSNTDSSMQWLLSKKLSE